RSAKSHIPFRFFQFSRLNCGRGYSCQTFSGETSFAQRVISGAVVGDQAAAHTLVNNPTVNAAISRLISNVLPGIAEQADLTGPLRKKLTRLCEAHLCKARQSYTPVKIQPD